MYKTTVSCVQDRMTLSDTRGLGELPQELLEIVFSHLKEPVSLRRVSQVLLNNRKRKLVDFTTFLSTLQVCCSWRRTVFRLRWLGLLTWRRKGHTGILQEASKEGGWGVVVRVEQPVLLAGVLVLVPTRWGKSP